VIGDLRPARSCATFLRLPAKGPAKGGTPLKPQSIKLFDFFYLGSTFLSVLGFITGYRNAEAQLAAQGAERGLSISPLVITGLFAVSILISLLLWYLVSRKRMVVAKWIIVFFFLLSLVGVGDYFVGTMALAEIYSLIALIANAVAVSMLFRSDAIRWLENRPPADEA